MRTNLCILFLSTLILSVNSPSILSKADNDPMKIPVHSIVSNMEISIRKSQYFNIIYNFVFTFDFTIFNELGNEVGITYSDERNIPVFIEYNLLEEINITLDGQNSITNWIITKKTISGNTTSSFAWDVGIKNYDKPIIPNGNFTLVPLGLHFGQQLETNDQNSIKVDEIAMTAIVRNSSISYIQDDLILCNCPKFFENLESNFDLTSIFNFTLILGLFVSLKLSKRLEKR